MVAHGRGQDGAEHIRGQASAKPSLARVQHERKRQQQQREPTSHRPAGALGLCKSHDALHVRNRHQGIRPETRLQPPGPARRRHQRSHRRVASSGDNRPRDGKRRSLGGIGLREQDDRNHDWAVDSGTPAAPRVVQYSEHGRQEGGGDVQSQRSDPNPPMDALDTGARERCSERCCPDDDEPRRGGTRRSPMSGEPPPRHTAARPGPRRPRSDSTGSSKAQPNASRRRPLREPGAGRPPARPGAKAYSREVLRATVETRP